ncbi:MAG TPA: peptidylprolyl isomerase [Myxococcota bacterium]|nr:peptidylprolyl isomerase [Myxococcota bacterium]
MAPTRDAAGAERPWRAALRAPLLHFLVLGALLAGLRPAEPPSIVIDAAAQARLRRDFERREARPPSEAELAALVDEAIDEEVLLREAIDAGALRHDGTVVNRLVQLGRFLGPEAAASAPVPAAIAAEPAAPGREAAPGGDPGGATPDDAVARARALGLDRSDPVVRRYLLERARLTIASEADTPEPSEAELRTYLAGHAEAFRTPERLRLHHVFVRGDRPDAGARAARLAAALSTRVPEDARALGDAFPSGGRVVASGRELALRFGREFVAALDPAARGRWQGPIPSAHGLHLVWLEDPLPARDPRLDEVRTRVRQALLQERRTAHLRRRLDGLRARLAITVE